MPEFKLDADAEIGWALLPEELRALASGDTDMPLGLPTALRYIADQIAKQLPKVPVEEPAGDCVVFFSLNHPHQGVGWAADDGKWEDGSGSSLPWEQLVGDAKATDVMLYRRVPYPEPPPVQVEADKVPCIGFADASPHAPHRWLDGTDVDLVVPAWYDCPGKPEPSPVQVEAEPVSDLEYATRLDGSTMPAPRVVPNEFCWCGGEVGSRVPGDHLGLGCLLDITHNWNAASLESQQLIEREQSTPAEDDPIEALVQAMRGHEPMVWGGPGAEIYGCRCGTVFDEPDDSGSWETAQLSHVAARVLEVGGQQPGVPVEKVRALAEFLRMGAPDRYVRPESNKVMRATFKEAADHVASLLPEEPTS